jgi:CcmD family protein
MENAGYLFAAYTIIWAVLFVFVLVLINRQAGLKREIDRLRQLIKDRESPRQSG